MAPPQTSEEAEDVGPARPWKSTDEYKYPVPKPQGDHWDIILERFLTKDKFQCEAWKDEVQNLLLFAGLFSAVVTAFAVESYKTLQPDPNADLTLLLARIAAGVDTLTNKSEIVNSAQNPGSFSPTTTSIHINIFWFSSLILSLATVIVGIVSLQWLREHQRYTEPLTSKQALAVFHLRSAALKKWGISHIFTTLPLILQAAVVLFFIGLGEFLFVLSPTVAAPSLVLIGLPVMFLITTTVLPSAQLLSASFRLSPDSSIPTQCAYKSPQSWAFLHLCLIGIRIPRLFRRLLSYIPYSRRLFTDFDIIGGSLSKACRKFLGIIPLPLNVQVKFNHQSWVDFDVSWLSVRDMHYLSQKKALFKAVDDHIRPHYDLVQSLVTSAREHAIHEQALFAAYHAMKELCDAVASEDALDEKSERELISRVVVLQSGFPPFQSETFSRKALGLPGNVMRDEMMLTFLRLPGISNHSSDLEHPTGLHRMELFTRMLVYNRFREVGYERGQLRPTHPFLFEIQHAERTWDTLPYPEDMVEQQCLILEHIFAHAFNRSSSENITSGRYAMLTKYFSYIASIRISDELEPNFLSILSVISKCLNFSLQGQAYGKADFLFFCVRLYFENLARNSWFSDLMISGSYRIRRNFTNVLETLLLYEDQLDKYEYWEMTRTWDPRSPTFHWTGGFAHPANPGRSIYEPIPETLLRFLPYERRRLYPQNFLSNEQPQDHFDEIKRFPEKVELYTTVNYVYALQGENISFAEPQDDTW